MDAEELPARPAERAHAGIDLAGPEECQPLAVLREVSREGGNVAHEGQTGRVGRPRELKRRQNAVGVASDQLERAEARAGSAEDTPDIG